jgi:hypothetical protein
MFNKNPLTQIIIIITKDPRIHTGSYMMMSVLWVS